MKIERGGIINDFIQPNRKQYAIPVYQRNYEWTREQCTRLFEDIVAAHKHDRDHFTGSIIYAPLKTENKIDYFIIVDGQQRLTTIYILIKALIDMAESEREKKALEEVVFNEDKFKQYQIDESSKLKLKPVKSDNQQLMLLMENRIDEIDKNSGIYRNYTRFRELISDAIRKDEQLGIDQIFDGIEHLTCAAIKLDSDDNAQEIFERINSTGIPLNLADKIRNFALMTDIDQERLYEDYWLATENLVGYNSLTDFFLDYLNIKVDSIPREDQAYEIFKQVFRKNAYTNKSMLEEILHYARFYHAFLYGDPQYSVSVNDTLAALRSLKQTTVYPFLFRVFDDYHDKIIDQTTLEKVLSFLLNYSIRRSMCEISSSSLRGLYKTLYNRIFSHANNKAHYYDALVSFFRQLLTRDAWIDDETFSNALTYHNLYRKSALCKYLLTVVENNGKEQIFTDNLTIEHVLPQNKKVSPEWQKMLGDDWEKVYERYLHTLGNLTLTGYNSELGDRPFAEKKKHFSDVSAKTVTLNRFICACDSWNAEKIETRAKELVSFILKQFPDVIPQTVISFADPRYQLYSCNDTEAATFKTPNYYELLGERVNVATFAEMLRSVIERLYKRDSSIIENMAKSNDVLGNGSQIIMFSYDKTRFGKTCVQLEGTDIYGNVRGFNAKIIMLIIRALLDKYGIDMEDFAYSARHTN